MLVAFSAHAEVTLDWVTVGAPGNACDTQSQGCFGAVASRYRIGRFEVSNAQYAEFLNAVASTDTNGLYHSNMGSVPNVGGIAQSGSAGSFTYSAIVGRAGLPVNWVSFWDAARFANWLHNGQPTGAQDATTTEDGAYTLTPDGIANNTVVRNAGAEVFVPSEDEWFKAAYFDAISSNYNPYPFADGNGGAVCESPPGSTSHSANCGIAHAGDVSGAGSYTGSASPSATFDQGGNVYEWNEAIVGGSERGLRGGAYLFPSGELAASLRNSAGAAAAGSFAGFRVASPATFPQGIPAVGPVGRLIVVAGLLGFGAYSRWRA